MIKVIFKRNIHYNTGKSILKLINNQWPTPKEYRYSPGPNEVSSKMYIHTFVHIHTHVYS